MNAAKKFHSWEAENEERLHLVIESIAFFSKRFLLTALNAFQVLIFISYKFSIWLGRLAYVVLSAPPLRPLEREESWIYRQIK